ncbi:MAG: aminopeptidase [Lachnospiraceae bacterium]|nr:aminopeptidase [Lachnospiraceae bacterium]
MKRETAVLDRRTLQTFQKRLGLENGLLPLAENIQEKGLLSSIFQAQDQKVDWFDFPDRIPGYPVSNQHQTGRCWIHAGFHFLKTWFLKEYGLSDFHFSCNYLAFYDLLEKANYFLELILETLDEDIHGRLLSYKLAHPIQDAGQWSFFADLIEKYGMVPENAMPDTSCSRKTGELICALSDLLRRDACILRRNADAGTSLDELHQQKESMCYQIYRLLCITLGKPPEQFEFTAAKTMEKLSSARMTPDEFRDRYLRLNLKGDYVVTAHVPMKNKQWYQTYAVRYLGCLWEGSPVTYLNLPLDVWKALIRTQLHDHMPVWFGCDSRMNVDTEHGIFSLDNYDFSKIGCREEVLNKGERLDYQLSFVTHAMLLKGSACAPDNTIERWLVENSYGPDAGHEGYLSMSDAWFDQYVYEAVIHKKYFSRALLKLHQKTPLWLEPWDPVGALA